MGADIKNKAVYTAYSRTLSMVISIVSQFVLTPIILSFLGTSLYGVYAIINKSNNFLSLVDIRPTAVLRLRLAFTQKSDNIADKQCYIGASYIISIFSSVFFIAGGAIFAYYFPSWFNIPKEQVYEARIAIVLLSVFLSANGFLGVPEAILRGNNIEYKGFFVEPLRQVIVAGVTIYFLVIGLGLLSVVYAMFIGSLFAYISRLFLQHKHLPDYTAKRPTIGHIKYFVKKGGWYMVSSVMVQVINNFDVILIGMLVGTEAVAVFAITKAIVFRIVESIETLVTSSTSSIGEIVGSRDVERISKARISLYKIVWPLSVFIVSYFILFNGTFISFWTGSQVYAGELVNLIICISAIFLMLGSTEEIFILSTLNFKIKAAFLFISAIVAISISIMLNSSMGLLGNAIGILSGRLTLYLLYCGYNNKITQSLMKIGKKTIFGNVGFLFLLCIFKSIITTYPSSSILSYITYSVIYSIIAGTYVYAILMDKEERNRILNIVLKRTK